MIKKSILVIMMCLLMVTSIITLLPTASASVSGYQVESVSQTGLNEITVVIGGKYCSACKPNDPTNPNEYEGYGVGCTEFTHGPGGTWEPGETGYYWCYPNNVAGRYAAAMIEYGPGPTQVTQKFVCTPANWPLNVYDKHAFVFTGVSVSGGETVKVYGELYCSWCGHWYSSSQLVTVKYGPSADADGPYNGYENVAVTLDGSGSYHTDPTNTHYITTYEWDLDNDGYYDDATGMNPAHTWTTAGTYTIGLKVTDDQSLSDTDTATVTILANQPPVADAGPDQTDVEQTSHAGAEVTLDGSGSYDPDSDPLTYTWTWSGGSTTGVTPKVTFPYGTTTVTLEVDDGLLTDTDTVDITIVDTTAPTLEYDSEDTYLWPPNHKYHTIDLGDYLTAVSDICDPNVDMDDVVITSVSSDEPENAIGDGDGNTVDDIVIVDSQTVDLRAERQGGGNGRVYTINFAVTDSHSNTATGSIKVCVPHDSKDTAVDDGASAGYTVTA